MLDITMTACKRPEILEKTLWSFSRLMDLNKKETRLIINIDPVGEDVQDKVLVDICLAYFPNTKFRLPREPSFPKAFKWVWEQVEAPYILHLEDDWELVRPAILKDITNLLHKYDNLMILRLPAFISGFNNMKNWNRFFPWNGEFFECPENLIGGLGFCGHPSIIKREFIKKAVEAIDDIRNPEKQLKWRNPIMGPFIMKKRFGVFSVPDSPPVIKDIGRRWMIKNGWRKEGAKAYFVKWKKVDE